MSKYRILSTTILLAAIIFLPYWLYLSLILVGMLAFPFYWEAILLSFLIEVLYGPGTLNLLSPLSISITVLLLVLLPFRERMRMYR
jgi:hypothetical protein